MDVPIVLMPDEVLASDVLIRMPLAWVHRPGDQVRVPDMTVTESDGTLVGTMRPTSWRVEHEGGRDWLVVTGLTRLD